MSASNASSDEQPRGQRRLLRRDSVSDRQPEPRDRDRRRVATRAIDTPAERPAERERHLAGERSTPPTERDAPEGTRAYLYEDPSSIDTAQRVSEGVLRARRHVLTHEESRLFRDSSAQADAARDMSSNQPSRDLQRRFSREPAPRRSETQLPSYGNLLSAAGPLPPLRDLNRDSTSLSSPGSSSGRVGRLRPAAERLMERYRSSEHRASNLSNPSSFEDLEYDLDDANSQLRALLEYTNPTISSPLNASSNTRMSQHDQAEDSRRVKRRKLDTERVGSGSKGFRYGISGQVEPGQLRMEIESCDGGIFADDENNPPESILKLDDSVYCTKRDSCNIVLMHQGATVFTLSELVIRAPGRRYSSPVREGMVFVSMTADEIFNRTAQYKVKYVPSQETRNSAERENQVPIMSVRHNEDGTTTSYTTRLRNEDGTMTSYTTRLRRRGMHHGNSCLEDAMDYKTAVFPADPLPFPVTVATDCSEPEDSMVHPRIRRQPTHVINRIGTLPFESDSSEDGENNLGWDDIRFDNDEYYTPPPDSQRRAQEMTLAEAAEASQLATQEAVQAVGGKLLRPHAKFFIERGNNRCTLKFDPPVTGRFILLKMYHPSENIDIQGVYAKGFAGPRFFPSVELR